MTARRRVMSALATTLVVTALASAEPAHADDPVPGALTSGDPLFPHQGNGGYEVGHYDLEIAWNPGLPLTAGTIDATTTITAATTGPPLSSFGLDLEGLSVTSVTVDGVPATYTRTDQGGPEPPAAHKLVVTPATPVAGPFTVAVGYAGTPLQHTDTDGSPEGWVPTLDGVTLLGQPIGSMTGFPNNDTPQDKATYTISVDVPQSYEVASNGVLVSSGAAAGRRVWVWDETRPMASELALVSIGQYDMFSSDVSLGGGRMVPEWSFVDPALPQSTKDAVATERAQLSTVLTGLESLFGPYPGPSTGVVVDQVLTGYALETQDRPFFPSGLAHETLVHELTHQWYGDAVSPTVWNDLWINEGMATWAPVHQAGDSTYDTFHGEWESLPADDDSWDVPPAGITDTADLFGFQSYERGAMTYEAMRTLLGETRFRTFVATWQARYGGQSRGRAAFVALAEELAGQDLTAFFSDWLLEPGKPAWPDPLPLPPPPPAMTIGAGCRVHLKGTPVVGRKLKAKVRGCPAGAGFGYRWFAGSHRIKGATQARYRVPAGKVGKRIKVKVTIRATGYLDAVRVSRPTRKVRG